MADAGDCLQGRVAAAAWAALEENPCRIAHEPIARLGGAVKRYGKLTALDGADLTLRRGELLALLGPNGAGKTTAIAPAAGSDPRRCRHGRAVRPGSAADRGAPAHRRDAAERRAAGDPAGGRTAAPDRQLLPGAAHAGGNRRAGRRQRSAHASLRANSPAASSGACNSRWRCAAARKCCSWMSPPWAWTSRRGRNCGRRSASWSPKDVRSLLTTHYLEEAEALADRVCVMAHGRDDPRRHASTNCAHGWRCNASVASPRLSGRHRARLAARSAKSTRRRTPEHHHRRGRRRGAPIAGGRSALRELEVQRAGLAEAFTELTREADEASNTDQHEAA